MKKKIKELARPEVNRQRETREWGGKRSGAGRPKGSGTYGEPTTAIRIPSSELAFIQRYLSTFKTKGAGNAGNYQSLVKPDPDSHAVFIPLYASRVAAGFPSPADDYVENRLDLNKHLIAHKEATFFLRVQGESMTGAGIFDGDLLVVDRAIEPSGGNIIVAAIDGELTVKRLHKNHNRVWLAPENPSYPVMEFKNTEEVLVWGVVTYVIHKV